MQFTIGQLNIENLSLDENVIFEKEVEIIEEGCLNAILYWFDCIFIEYSYSTIASDSFINQCAWLISPRIEVKKSDIIKIRAIYHSCFLYFSVEKCKR